MKLLPNNIYHIYNRGNNKQNIFFNMDNYLYFINKVRKQIKPLAEIMAYCLMPNHFHFFVYTPIIFDTKIFADNFKILLSSYTRAINKQQKTTGSLFQQHSRAKCLSYGSKSDTNYGLICFNYIHQNPYLAGLVKKMEDWEYSSFKDFIGLRNGTLCNKEFSIKTLGLPLNIQELYKLSYNNINRKEIDSIS